MTEVNAILLKKIKLCVSNKESTFFGTWWIDDIILRNEWKQNGKQKDTSDDSKSQKS